MAGFAATFKRTLSTTASWGSVGADATRPRRLHLAYFYGGVEGTPADNAFLLRIRRCTALGTSTAVTPVMLNPADSATEADAGENHSAEPTYTANTEIFEGPFNQRGVVQYASAPGREIWTPATASNGFGFETPTASALAGTATVHVIEQ